MLYAVAMEGSEMPASNENTTISLTNDESLVLFALLSRWIEEGATPTPPADCFASSAECAALQRLHCLLEKSTEIAYSPEYKATLAAARDRLAPDWSGLTLRD